jgi:hypothetical protein
VNDDIIGRFFSLIFYTFVKKKKRKKRRKEKKSKISGKFRLKISI